MIFPEYYLLEIDNFDFKITYILISKLPPKEALVSFCRKRLKKNKNTVSDFSFGSIEICFNLHINHTTAEMKSRNEHRFMR